MNNYVINGIEFATKQRLLNYVTKIKMQNLGSEIVEKGVYDFMVALFKHSKHDLKKPYRLFVSNDEVNGNHCFYINSGKKDIDISVVDCIKNIFSSEQHEQKVKDKRQEKFEQLKEDLHSIKMPFGKHKGEPLKEVLRDSQYMGWLFQQDWLDKQTKLYKVLNKAQQYHVSALS